MRTNETTNLVRIVDLIKTWHYDRNLIAGSDDKTQFAKLISEAGELATSIAKGKDVRDDIGDMIVVLINIAERNGVSLTECVDVAYRDIRDRRGRMVDGTFVKEADLIKEADLSVYNDARLSTLQDEKGWADVKEEK